MHVLAVIVVTNDWQAVSGGGVYVGSQFEGTQSTRVGRPGSVGMAPGCGGRCIRLLAHI